MVWIQGGTFMMGSENGKPDEQPAHPVTVHGFWMDKPKSPTSSLINLST